MGDEYDPDIVEQMLDEALTQMRIKGRNFPTNIVRLVRDLADLAQINMERNLITSSSSNMKPEDTDGAASGEGAAAASAEQQQPGSPAAAGGATLDDKKVISARACVVCGRDDRPGEARKSGFKCTECIGLPSQNKFKVEVEEFGHMERTENEFGEKVINEFAFLHALGRGSYGKVKLAVHNKSGQQYAVKILNKANLMKAHAGSTGSTGYDKVLQEIRIMKTLRHPNIINIYAVIDDPDEYKLYVVMELLDKGQVYSIDQTGMGEKTIETERLKKFIVGIAQGLLYLHGKGIVHRDIKPENILLDKHDNVKLADFGVSSTCDHGTDLMTSTEGSPAFLPPEEFLGKPVQGRAQDVWAFGVTLYSMAFAKLPFRATSRRELERVVIETEPEYPEDANPLLVDLVKKMLSKDQNDRPPVSSIIDHPFVSDVRCVKGFPVETVTAKIEVVDNHEQVAGCKPESDAVVVRRTNVRAQPSKGCKELDEFLTEEGPDFQLVRGGTYSITLYSIKSDPRRKKQRKFMEEFEAKKKAGAEAKQ